MSKKLDLFKRNRLVQSFKYASRSGSLRNKIKIFPNNSIEHETTKFLVAYKLIKEGYDVWSEVEFTRNGRADLVAIKEGEGYIIEILHSETKEMCEKKSKKYPREFSKRFVETKNFNIDSFKL